MNKKLDVEMGNQMQSQVEDSETQGDLLLAKEFLSQHFEQAYIELFRNLRFR